jgi:2-phospho-L-lactate transferase/gluconeogenesis factor (CofD/UPF0052 family)
MSKRFASSDGRAPDAASVRVAVFCGGRGSSSILRALLRSPGVHLTLLVNAYDDGLSTGRLRGFVPGMLGASDFRKNLSRLLEMSSPVQFAVADLLEYRFPQVSGPLTLEALLDALAAIARRRAMPRATANALPAPLPEQLARLDADTAHTFHTQLKAFARFAQRREEPFSFDDCALGNLLLAGAYVANGGSFNAAVAQLAAALHCRADVLNVTRGENRILVALKADGEVLEREARIVGAQSAVPIRSLYQLREILTPSTLAHLATLDVDQRAAHLASLHSDVDISPEADTALRAADAVIYGPGTQHSSLLPSYLTRGVADAIASGNARHRVFVVNLHDDYDTQGLGPAALVKRTLDTLGDPQNTRRFVTDILLPRERADRDVFDGGTFLGARVIEDTLENTVVPGVHNGARVADGVRHMLESETPEDDDRLEVYVDLHRRSIAVDALVQEFAELPWTERFTEVHLRINGTRLEKPAWPSHLSLSTTGHTGLFSEISMLLAWLRDGRSRFLASVTGDGEYRLRDIEMAVDLLRTRRFGVILGARNQSKRQFFGSLRYAYAGRQLMYAASVAGGFGVAALCGARFGLILSDPLTGFRVYDRLAIPRALRDNLLSRHPRTTLEITGRLVDYGVELAEVPVFYHSYPGFTDERWRLLRGLVNAVSVLR